MKKLVIALMCLALSVSAALAEGASVDIDLTRMGSEGAVNALYDVLDAPEENQGRTAKIKGVAYRIEGDADEPYTYYLVMDDPTSCCGGPQIEFVPASLPDDALDADEITVTGTLEFGEGFWDVRLVDASVELPVV